MRLHSPIDCKRFYIRRAETTAYIYLLWKGAEAWMDKAHWSEFVTACGKVAVVGAVSILTPWLWNMFVS